MKRVHLIPLAVVLTVCCVVLANPEQSHGSRSTQSGIAGCVAHGQVTLTTQYA